MDRASSLMMYSLGTLSNGEDPSASFGKAIRGLASVRMLSRRHREVAESGVGRFTNAAWAAVRRDKAASFRELDEARQHEDPWTRNMAVMMAAMFRENEGDVEQMAADLAVALEGFRAIGDRWGTSLALRGLASYQSHSGDHEGALESLTEALRLIGELGTKEGVVAAAVVVRGEPGGARRFRGRQRGHAAVTPAGRGDRKPERAGVCDDGVRQHRPDGRTAGRGAGSWPSGRTGCSISRPSGSHRTGRR